MSGRPTPEEIESMMLAYTMQPSIIDRLHAHGYRIVHPDDVPERTADPNDDDVRWGAASGWNECRRHIFGGDQ